MPSSPSVSSSTNIGGNNIKFTIEQGEDIVYNGKNCYLTAQLQIVQVREDGVTMTPFEPIINTGVRAHPSAISIPHHAKSTGCNPRHNETSYRYK